MKKFIFSLVVLLFGCSDPGDQPGTNLKKGDEFFAKNEYEVAEYYYDQIPEDSPFFRQAQKKLNAIAVVKAKWKVVESDSTEISQVVLVENKYKADNVSRVPIHSITIANNSKKKLESVNIEFTYFNQEGTVIATLLGDVKTPVDPESKNIFDNVSPGILQERFVNCEARIINAHFH